MSDDPPMSQLKLTKKQRRIPDEDSSGDDISDNDTTSEDDNTDCSWDSSDEGEESAESEHEDAVENPDAHPFECDCQQCELSLS